MSDEYFEVLSMKFKALTKVDKNLGLITHLLTNEVDHDVLVHQVINTKEAGINWALIKLGWTPPEDDNYIERDLRNKIREATREFDMETLTRSPGWKERALSAAKNIIGHTDTLSCFHIRNR